LDYIVREMKGTYTSRDITAAEEDLKKVETCTARDV